MKPLDAAVPRRGDTEGNLDTETRSEEERRGACVRGAWESGWKSDIMGRGDRERGKQGAERRAEDEDGRATAKSFGRRWVITLPLDSGSSRSLCPE